MTRIYNLTIYSKRRSDAYQLRADIRTFLGTAGNCEVLGGGISCLDPSATDLDVRFRSKKLAWSLLAALRAAYAERGEIDAS
jgi:hypothetical protein